MFIFCEYLVLFYVVHTMFVLSTFDGQFLFDSNNKLHGLNNALLFSFSSAKRHVHRKPVFAMQRNDKW